jgi:hypothetical protein
VVCVAERIRIHMFLGLLDLDPDPSVRGMDPSFTTQKKVRKTLIPTALGILFDFLSLKIMYMYLQKVISKKTITKIVFCWHLGKVNDENSRIRIHIRIRIRIRIRPLVRGMDPRIRIHPKMSWIRNTGCGALS